LNTNDDSVVETSSPQKSGAVDLPEENPADPDSSYFESSLETMISMKRVSPCLPVGKLPSKVPTISPVAACREDGAIMPRNRAMVALNFKDVLVTH